MLSLYNNIYVLVNNQQITMTITYDNITRKYHATDSTQSWYAIGNTMLEAIQRALSIKLYWQTVDQSK